MDNKQMENLLKFTASRLGTSPEALKEAAKSGKMENIVGKGKESELLTKVLSDKDAARKLLSSPQAQQLLKMFGQK